MVAAVIGVLSIALTAVAALYMGWVSQAIQDAKRVDAVTEYPGRPTAMAQGVTSIGSTPVNFLVVGLGTGGDLEVAYIAHLNAAHTSLALVTLPRTTVLAATGDLTLAEAFTEEGLAGLTRQVEESLGLRLDHGVVIDLPAFTDVISVEGGITVRNPATIRTQGRTWSAGDIRLTGHDAVSFMDARGTGPGAEALRAQRHTVVLVAALQRLTELSMVANPMAFRQAMIELTEATALDAGTSASDLESLAADIRLQRVVTVPAPLTETTVDVPGLESVYLSDAAAMAALGEELRGDAVPER
ncbi:MAG: LCP family protein [Propionibacteriaceae bacterium]|nr:hypothetical protein [Propionibacteriaceae bacterium]HBY22643.1 hypothetical protein [Propionibacteriaceae bacterium]